jgi:hypothetical protein
MPRQVPRTGDTFAVPLDDGSFGLGQVVDVKPIFMNSITCAFFVDRAASPDDLVASSLQKSDIISCLLVTRDQFNKGKWRRIGNAKVSAPTKWFPYREVESSGWVGAKVIGSGIINSFLSAYHGLRNWEEMKDPKYYDSLLRDPSIRRPYA